MTLKEAAQKALDCQDAVNLSGVVFTFCDVMHVICHEANVRNEDTDWKNRHPIVRLFIDKLQDLSGGRMTDGSEISDMYHEVEMLAGRKDERY